VALSSEGDRAAGPRGRGPRVPLGRAVRCDAVHGDVDHLVVKPTRPAIFPTAGSDAAYDQATFPVFWLVANAPVLVGLALVRAQAVIDARRQRIEVHVLARDVVAGRKVGLELQRRAPGLGPERAHPAGTRTCRLLARTSTRLCGACGRPATSSSSATHRSSSPGCQLRITWSCRSDSSRIQAARGIVRSSTARSNHCVTGPFRRKKKCPATGASRLGRNRSVRTSGAANAYPGTGRRPRRTTGVPGCPRRLCRRRRHARACRWARPKRARHSLLQSHQTESTSHTSVDKTMPARSGGRA